MSNELIEDYTARLEKLRHERDLNRERMKAANLKLTNQILESYNENSYEILEKQRILMEKLDLLEEQSRVVGEQSQKYAEFYKQVNGYLKKVGDLYNFLEKVDAEMQEIAQ